MTSLERAAAAEIERYLPEGWRASVRASAECIVVEVTAGRGAANRSIIEREPGEHGRILSEWCRLVAGRLMRVATS